MILLIDNYDSFSYNLYQILGGINPAIRVARNDAITVEEIAAMSPSHIVLSPGPGKPSDSGVCPQVISAFSDRFPILGVCLGHQAICEVFGATVTHARHLMHGKASPITLDTSCPLFAGLPSVIEGARYHSLAAVEASIPASLSVSARSSDGEVMGVHLRGRAVYGVQFHPESILTPLGSSLLKNFLSS
ncbi:MAG: aminodeoxychorismate/anthranilate synthase component II [Spirochaetaceae bacterium]|jgi:anthranilate synthase component 2|nr:aminodeoxychorismate/anthranilate synthase component II [Spirochaetaceae bacterium]